MANGNFAGGDGSETNPYLIEDAFDLDAVRNDLSAHYKLVNDIDLDISPFNEGEGWNPIGDNSDTSQRFKGVFDGDGYVVKNLYINRPSTNNVGLFGCTLNSAIVRNLGVEDVNVSGNYDVGGLVGYSISSIITNSYSTGGVNGGSYVGGLVGRIISSSIITNSYSTGSVNGNDSVGGLVGRNTGSIITNSYSTGGVNGGSYVGGLVGINTNDSTITNSYSTGDVSSSGNYVGGLTGSITSTTTITNSYSTGDVSSSGSNVGGLVGNILNSAIVTNSFWNIETSNQTTSAGGVGLATQEMKTAQTFIDVGWDEEINENGEKIWVLLDGYYPSLWFNPTIPNNFLLHLDNGEYRYWKNSTWNKLTNTPTKSDFEEYGMTSLSNIPKSAWKELSNISPQIKIITYVPKNNTANDFNILYNGLKRTVKMSALPFGQFIVSNTDIKLYGSVKQAIATKLDEQDKKDGIVKIVMSFDGGKRWNYYSLKDNSFKLVDINDIDLVKEFGNTIDEVNNISQDVFDQNTKNTNTIRISYYIEESIRDNDSSKIDKLELIQEAVFNTPEVSDVNFDIINTIYNIDLTLIGRDLTGKVSDSDHSRIRYRVFLNGKPYYPLDGNFTEFQSAPLHIALKVNSQDIKIGEENDLSLEFEDYWGVVETWETTFVGQYYGLIFEDPESNAYATDIGEVLKYLNVGTLIAGQNSSEFEIRLHNTHGYAVENPVITSYSKHSGIKFELSKTQSPFIAEESLSYDQKLLDGEYITFYLRLATELTTPPVTGGIFEIRVNADQVID